MFSKAFGSTGGLCRFQETLQYLAFTRIRMFISCALPPVVIAAIPKSAGARHRAAGTADPTLENADYFHAQLRSLDWILGESPTL